MTVTHDTLKVALVTGAARGIGPASASWFLDHGHAVALLDIDGATLDAAAAALAMPGRVPALHADVRDAAQVSATVATVEARFGRLDVLANNAGIAVFKPLLHTGFDAWRQVIATNLDGPFLCTQAAAPLMLKHGSGAVVSVPRTTPLRRRSRCAEVGAMRLRRPALNPPRRHCRTPPVVRQQLCQACAAGRHRGRPCVRLPVSLRLPAPRSAPDARGPARRQPIGHPG